MDLRQHLRTQNPSLLTLATINLPLLLLLLTSPVVLALPNTGLSRAKRADIPETPPSEPDCGFDGNQSAYGLGIRMGLYFQWMASNIAYNSRPTDAEKMTGINNCFQAAVFAGLLFLTITKGSELFAVEAYLMLSLCVGGMSTLTAPFSRQFVTSEPSSVEKPSVSSHKVLYISCSVGDFFQTILNASLMVYALWFVFYGMDHMNVTPCSTFGFFFSKVNLYGWYRIFLKIVLVLSWIPIILIIFLIIFLPKSWNCVIINSMTGTVQPAASPSPDGESPDTGPNDASPKVTAEPDTSKATRFRLPGVGLITSILTAELTIRWNKIRGMGDVGSTAQLFPLIVGVGWFVRVMVHILIFKRGKASKGFNRV